MTGKLRLFVGLGFPGADHEAEEELPDDWADMSEADRLAYCEQALEDHIGNYLESTYDVVEDES